jgi:hypothetical protein
MAKRIVRVTEDPEQWIDPEKIVMAKAVSNTAKHELTRLWLDGMGSTGITVPGRPEFVLQWLAPNAGHYPEHGL